jgi:general nucleoside transport system ATP-binding protein
MSEPPELIAVDMRGISKRFPGVVANDQVDFEVRAGEIHALLGENGAGKSTLMSVLCGLYLPDEGEIFLGRDGRLQPALIDSPRDAIEQGIGMVHQHFKLVQPQSVAENVILGLDGTPFRLRMAEVEKRIAELGKRYHLQVDARALIWQLSVGEQQRVEILKLLYRGAEILILDEPTAVLTPQEAAELGKTLRQMAGEGKAIVFISHKLDEVLAFADRITVLRDGKNVATVAVGETNKAELARLMVGREVIFRVEKDAPEIGDVVLSVQGLRADNNKGLPALRGVSFEIRSGEILGLAGVAGNGQQELAETLTGLRPATGGEVLVRGVPMTNRSPLAFIRQGVGHIPGDRLGMGLAGNLPVSDNLIMKAYRRRPISSGLFLVSVAVTRYAREVIEMFKVQTPSVATPARNLSGGNQQKAIVGREILSSESRTDGRASLIVAVHPTRGLDVGAIEAVRSSILEQRRQGAAILFISEELDELTAMSDRIAVIHGGQIMGIVEPSETSVEELGLMMAGERSE